jgi:hypothetical protein
MKTLPLNTDFHVRGEKGWTFRIMERIGDVALVRKTHAETTRTAWEVAIVQRHDAYEKGNVKIEAAETMPSTSQWGRLGWTYRDEKSAKVRFDELVKSAKEKTS